MAGLVVVQAESVLDANDAACRAVRKAGISPGAGRTVVGECDVGDHFLSKLDDESHACVSRNKKTHARWVECGSRIGWRAAQSLTKALQCPCLRICSRHNYPLGFKGQALRLLEAHKNSRWHWYCHAAMNGAPKMQAVWVIAYPFTFWRVELHYAILVIPK